ncbi:hypothetical protein J5N97_010530 [Dioscorea zingiberensis]|uniref:X8 domain-containing protein n=1 Tax=Dioscorea zingiberensis TaxID=325984 RepID=A0A9D5HMI3_9LILI|nr:hypothetical protein J5N97_010530 [Dioscorea zingiberensis]
MDMILKPFPPSEATFNSTWNSIMVEFLQFLKNTDSAFMLNAHPYNAYTRGEGTFPIDYALFQSVNSKKKIVDPNTLFEYSNMFDTMVDAAYYAMNALGISSVPVIVTESGWPWNGGSSDPAATVDNALVYNHNLIQHVLSGSGTPSQPTTETSAYIYELFNKDLHPGLLSEKNWGIVFPNGTATYSLNFEALTGNDSIVNGFFCIAKLNAKLDMVKLGLDWACGEGGADCSEIQPGKPCYLPNDLISTTSYAYNDYYQKKRASGGGCYFSDTAFLTNSDPSHGSCIFTGSPRKPDGQGPPSSAFSPANNDAFNKGVSVQVLPFSYLLPIILFSWLQGN